MFLSCLINRLGYPDTEVNLNYKRLQTELRFSNPCFNLKIEVNRTNFIYLFFDLWLFTHLNKCIQRFRFVLIWVLW